ncbi:MAG TPA: hypothetical protein VG605_05515 [Puia sp.]|nr:hypothetical protein [Puia sp.]
MARLLVGERNWEHRALLKEIFSRQAPSMVVDFVANGEDVLRYLAEQAPHNQPILIVLDPALPSIFPSSLVRLIKADSRFAKIPIVILADQAGADYYSLRSTGLVARSFMKPSLATGWEMLANRIIELTLETKTENGTA